MNAIAVDAGRLIFAAAKMGTEVIPGLLDSIRKAMLERWEYGKGKKATSVVGSKSRGLVQYPHERQGEMTADENEIVVYQPDETVRLDVRLDGDTVWLTQNQMTDLFQRDRTVITRHINNVFSEGELDEKGGL